MFKFKINKNARKFSELFSSSHKYPEVVQEIHEHFDTATEKILVEARKILAEADEKIIKNDKGRRLHNLGFFSTKESKEFSEVTKLKVQKELEKNTIENYSVEFPINKFILDREVNLVCQKYDLYVGEINNFMGFVPDKNLSAIESFAEKYMKENTRFYCYNQDGRPYSEMVTISKAKYLEMIAAGKSAWMEHNLKLYICAPIKDFCMTGNKKAGRMIVKDDPIVLMKVDMGYIIITAWGDEASDPIVVNEKQN